MGELIRIGAPEGTPGLGATVDTTGAWVTQFGFGQHEIFHRLEVNGEGKKRGGAHICSPGFGAVIEPQHGSARIEDWELVSSNSPLMNARPNREGFGVVMQWMPDSNTACEGLRHTLELSILQRRLLRLELTLANEDGQRFEVVAPGFHPYFKVDKDTSAEQVEKIYRPLTKGAAVCTRRIDREAELRGEVPRLKEKLILGNNTSYVESDLMTVVTWSDKPTEYVCYEPTQAGSSLNPQDGAIVLRRGESRRFFMSIATASIESRGPKAA